MRLTIGDGYTLSAKTNSEHLLGSDFYTDLPTVQYSYRPALPDAINAWNLEGMRANTGYERTTATAKLISDHVTEWDVMRKDGSKAPIDADHVRIIPMPILEQILNTILRWAPKFMEKSEGN